MKITKFVHSCLLVETPRRAGVIDPGQFSWESGLFNVDALERLDDIIITHEHFDHMHLPFVQALAGRFPDVVITTTEAAAAKLREAGISNIRTQGGEGVVLFESPHEDVAPLGAPPQEIGVHYLDLLTLPGDSHHFSETKDILALPVTAPWGSMAKAAQVGLDLKPRHIIPVHDWHWNADARAQAYDRLEAFFAEHGIKFVKPRDGEAMQF